MVLLPQRKWPGLQKVEGVVAERKKAVLNRSLKRFATAVFLRLVRVQPSATIAHCRRFTPCKGIQDSLGFWTPRCGFWITFSRFQYLSVELGFWIPDSN